MHHFCTYFDHNYLVRALPMYWSLARHCPGEFVLHALCLDDEAYLALARLQLPHVAPVRLAEVEAWDTRLLEAKQNRSKVEYYFTLTPAVLCYLFSKCQDIQQLTYLDADLFFYSSLTPIFDEVGPASVAIVPHRFPERLRDMLVHGTYNVAYLAFRRDASGIACVKWWFERCLEWCYDRVEDGKFADQRYLDDWPGRFQDVHVIAHKGADIAPWNVEDYRIRRDHGKVMVDDQPLVFYHFAGYRKISARLVDPGIFYRDLRCTKSVVGCIHAPYLRCVMKAKMELQRCFVTCQPGNTRPRGDGVFSFDESNMPRRTALRVFLEGRAVFLGVGKAWYIDSALIRRLLRWYDSIR